MLQGVAAIAAVALLATFAAKPAELGRIQRTNTLVLATPNSPTTYYLSGYGAAGPVYDLARRFADELGVRLKILEVANGHEALEAVAGGRADIAAPGIAAADRYPGLRFTPAYQNVASLLIYRTGSAVPSGIAELTQSSFAVTVAPGFAPLMQRLSKTHPGIAWETLTGRDSDELLVAVAQGKIAYTVVNENEFNLNKRFYPRLRVAFTLGSPQPLAWAVRKQGDDSLYQAAVAFFARAKSNQTLANVMDRYYGTNVAYSRVETLLFLDDVNDRLDRYAGNFQRVAAATGLSWQLLAAVGYQESHWNPNAVSPTGVRGLMMLTIPTARSLGIHNRTDPHLSIIGAARYLALLLERLPSSIPQPDRSWMALASYNVGIGHVMDARALTRRQGGNPDSWKDVKKRLVMLTESRYYQHARYGYADGRTAVHYVANIRSYYNILSWRTAQNTLPARIIQPGLATAVTTAK
ncbi:MAG: membrane-bound lytic murein transglycosylase MltF [Gammaproteobacteria bacterium]|nr:membrane-bound lytic murein transglycosylase MltF [Gammaproteobacteria bacterium]